MASGGGSSNSTPSWMSQLVQNRSITHPSSLGLDAGRLNDVSDYLVNQLGVGRKLRKGTLPSLKLATGGISDLTVT